MERRGKWGLHVDGVSGDNYWRCVNGVVENN